MQKRMLAAIWMAGAVCLAAFVFCVDDIRMLLAPLVAGGLTGWLLQSKAIGVHSNVGRSAAAGAACAFLSLPIMGLGVAITDDPQAVILETGRVFGEAFFIVFLSAFTGWWWLILVGAAAGGTLQLVWTRWERRWLKVDETQGI